MKQTKYLTIVSILLSTLLAGCISSTSSSSKSSSSSTNSDSSLSSQLYASSSNEQSSSSSILLIDTIELNSSSSKENTSSSQITISSSSTGTSSILIIETSSALIIESSSSNITDSISSSNGSSSSEMPPIIHSDSIYGFSAIDLSKKPTAHFEHFPIYSKDHYKLSFSGQGNFSDGSSVEEIVCLNTPNYTTRAQYDIIHLNDTLVLDPKFAMIDCFILSDNMNYLAPPDGEIIVHLSDFGDTLVPEMSDTLRLTSDIIYSSNSTHLEYSDLYTNSLLDISVEGQAFFDGYENDPMSGVIILYHTNSGSHLSVINSGETMHIENSLPNVSFFLADHDMTGTNPGAFIVQTNSSVK